MGKPCLRENTRLALARPGGVFWLNAYGNDDSRGAVDEKTREAKRQDQLRNLGSLLNGAKISQIWVGFDGEGRASDVGVLSGDDSFLGGVFWRVVRYGWDGKEHDRRR